MIQLTQPPYLQKGDTLAIVAPSGVLTAKNEAVYAAKKLAESWGLTVVLGAHVFADNFHFAGTDTQRLEDLQEALDNPTVKAIWCARGGYGAVRIIDQLDFTAFQKHPKWLIGYSDVTVLHSHLHTLGFETMHALMGSSFIDPLADHSQSIDSFKKALFGELLTYTIPANQYNQKGTATGKLVGGNLTLLQSLLGSKSAINTDGKILFIEEIGEYKYHIDRMLQSLQRAGLFTNCAGIVVGGMTDIKPNTPQWGVNIETLILQAVNNPNIPILFDFPAGHDTDNRALFLGRNVQITSNKTQASLIFEN